MTEFSIPPDFDFGQQFDRVTLSRAMAMKPQQALLSLHVHGKTLMTRMQGTALAAYDQRIEIVSDRLGMRVQGECSCPEAHNCKHVAAALMAFEAMEIRHRKNPEAAKAPAAWAGTAVAAPRVVREAPQREVINLGPLPLVPVLRLSTCVDVASEALLHHRYGSASTRNTMARQGSAQFFLRYQPPDGGPAVEYHFPAGPAEETLIERPNPAQPTLPLVSRFQRQGKQEAAALLLLLGEMGFRPWSLAAGLAHHRLTKVAAARTATAAPTHVLEGQPLVLVPMLRENWPLLLAHQIPELQRRGWAVEVAQDFPFELHHTEGWVLDVAEAHDGNWFDLGLKVSVEGQSVDLVPLLVGLVQSGWLKLDTALRDPDGEVLVPWPGGEPTAPGQAPRQRLLRLPVKRVAPLMDWLRSVFEAQGKPAPLRVSRFDLGAMDELSVGAKVVAPPSFTALIEEVRALRTGTGLPAIEPSPHVQATLRHYQRDGLAWMDFLRRAQLGGVLADDMGLGKTLQALTLLQGELDAGRLDRPSLVVVPTSLIGNWAAEARRFTPQLKVVVLHGPQRLQHFSRIRHAHLVLTTYPLAVRDIDTLAIHDWYYLMLDEAQRIKNSRSQAAQSVKVLRTQHRLCLSGTPLENHMGELWSLLDFVCPGLLGSEKTFREHYRNPIEKRQEATLAQHLARRVRPFILRRTKQQVALPAKTETHLRVELSGAQADLYETVRATMDGKLRDAIHKQGLARSQIMVLDALLKLRQVCCDPRLLKLGTKAPEGSPTKAAPSAKMELLLDLLPTLVEDGRRVLLFSQFTEMLALIETEVQRLKIPYLLLTGETQDRSGLVDRFQTGDVPLFLISLKAGGVGLNLTAADTVILYDPWWNPAVEQQAIDRAYRIGQDKPVFVYKLLASGTVEDKMLELQARKAGLADMLLSGVASDAALNEQDFDELFQPLIKPRMDT
jgi:superfamily II DNA or RNA helicase